MLSLLCLLQELYASMYSSCFSIQWSTHFAELVGLAEGEDVASMANKVIECSYNPELQTWNFMRIRPDKLTPNAYHVYTKVSILHCLHHVHAQLGS